MPVVDYVCIVPRLISILTELLTDTVSGRGGASIYGKQFEDEINMELKHTGTLHIQYK